MNKEALDEMLIVINTYSLILSKSSCGLLQCPDSYSGGSVIFNVFQKAKPIYNHCCDSYNIVTKKQKENAFTVEV